MATAPLADGGMHGGQPRLLLKQASMEELSKEWQQRADLERTMVEQQARELALAKTQLLEKEREVQALKDSVMGMVAVGDEVVDINAGGRIHSVSRATLCLIEGSLLASLFSGRWDDTMQRDTQGRPFLDVDPDCFEHILCFLRMKRLAGPGDRVELPKLSSGKQEAFQVFCRFYGLQSFMTPVDREILVLSPQSQVDALPTYGFGSEARGYSVKFLSPFRLAAVYVGLHGEATGCKVRVFRGHEVLREIPVIEVAFTKDPHVTHVAEGFDLLLEPPEASIMVLGNGGASIKHRNCGTSERVVSAFRVSAICVPSGSSMISNNSYHITMALALEDMTLA